MPIRKTQEKWLVFGTWVAFSTAATLLGFFLLRIVINPAGGKGNPILDAVAGVVSLGIPLPLAQWIITRRLFTKAFRWLVISPLALLFGLVMNFGLGSLGVFPIQAASTIGLAAIFGAIVGVSQWLFLRQYVPNAAVWIAASAIGWGFMTLTTGSIIEGFIEKLLFGLIPAVVTGFTLVYLLPLTALGVPDKKEIAV